MSKVDHERIIEDGIPLAWSYGYIFLFHYGNPLGFG
jgi:hypothetical protein